MGIASVLAENERLRAEIAARDAVLAQRDALVAEQEAKIAALTISNEDFAQRLDLIRIKSAARQNQRYVEGPAPIPLPFAFAEPVPPPRLPEAELAEAAPECPIPPIPPATRLLHLYARYPYLFAPTGSCPETAVRLIAVVRPSLWVITRRIRTRRRED